MEASLGPLRNRRAELLAEIEGLGNGTDEKAATLVSKRRHLRAIERQIARVEIDLLALQHLAPPAC
jgi:hypothetical protein